MTTTPSDPAYASPTPRVYRMRWKWAVAIVFVIAVLIAFLQLSESIEGNFRFPLTLAALALGAILLGGWVLFLTGLPWRRRFLIVAIGALSIILPVTFLRLTTHMQGSFTGAGVPRLVWNWARPVDEALARTKDSATIAVVPVDLKTTTPDDFPRFLGAAGDNAAHDAGLAHDWTSKPPRQLWRQPIGAGWGSFAVVNGYALTQEQRGPEEIVTCLEVATGKTRWQHANTTRFSEGMGGDGPRATPTIVGGRVYVTGATGIIDCLDGATGQPIWSRNILSDLTAHNETWGKSSSPLVLDHSVIVSGGVKPGQSLVALDRDSGKILWSAGQDVSAYASPVLASVAGEQQLLIVNAHSVAGQNPQTGDVRWQFSWPGEFPKVAQPIAFSPDRVFISAGYGLGSQMLHITPAADGAMQATPLWATPKFKTEFTNVVVKDGYIYGLDDGVLACIDVATGKRKWRDGHYGHGQIVRVGDLIIVQTEPGQVALVEASPDAFKELGSFSVFSSKSWNNPVVSGHYLLVRNDLEAACYELP